MEERGPGIVLLLLLSAACVPGQDLPEHSERRAMLEVSTNGICRYGNRVDCCWGWTRTSWGQCRPVCELGCKHGQCVGPDQCRCYNGYTGKTCSQDVNECGLKPRPCKHRCMNMVGSYKCFCLTGYMMTNEGTCRNARTCAMANCQYGCAVMKGEVMCQCPSPGLRLGPDRRTCVDIDECALGVAKCPRFRKCVNTFGSYICTCHKGFELRFINGKYQCTDKNSPCHEKADTKKCRCKPGTRGWSYDCKIVITVNVDPARPFTTPRPTPKITTNSVTSTSSPTTKSPAMTTITMTTTTTTTSPPTMTTMTTTVSTTAAPTTVATTAAPTTVATTAAPTTVATTAATTTVATTAATTTVATTAAPTTVSTTAAPTTVATTAAPTTVATTAAPTTIATTAAPTTVATTAAPTTVSTTAAPTTVATTAAPTTVATTAAPTTVATTAAPTTVATTAAPTTVATTAAPTTVATTAAPTTIATTAAPTTAPSTTPTMVATTTMPTTVTMTTMVKNVTTTTTMATTTALATTVQIITTTLDNHIQEITQRPRGDVYIPRNPDQNVFELDFDDIELGNTADFVLDDPAAVSLSCSFDQGVCSWMTDRDGDLHWEAVADPHGGQYLTVPEPKTGRTLKGARLTIPLAPPATPPWKGSDLCLAFKHRLQGLLIGSLQVFVKKGWGHSPAVWTRTSGQGWRHTRITLWGRGIDSVVFKGERRKGRSGEIAIDDVSIHRGVCNNRDPD